MRDRRNLQSFQRGKPGAAGPFSPARRTFPGARKGSSLVEMLVAIIILVVVLMGMFSMFLISRTAVYSKEDVTANTIALRYLEECEALRFATLSSDSPMWSGQKNFGKYEAYARVTELDSDPGSGKVYGARLQVDVKWDTTVGAARTLNGGDALWERPLERWISAGGHKNVGERN